MARLTRYFLPDQPLHVIQRGNNRTAIFFAPDDSAHYRAWLGAAAAEHGCAIHAYVLMTNHVHLLVSPRDERSLPRTLQSLGRRYVRHVNDRHRRSGTLWEGRYRATVIDSETYFLACCRYIELNPVRAGMVAAPGEYPWSSYASHAEGTRDRVLTEHPLYRALGRTAAARRDAYRALVAEPLAGETVDDIRRATNTGWALGGARFREAVARATGRRAAPLPRGRPKKAATEVADTDDGEIPL
jgi:putative transposase